MIIQHENINTVLTEQDLIDIYMEGYNRAINEAMKTGSTNQNKYDNNYLKDKPWLANGPWFSAERLSDDVKYSNMTPEDSRREQYYEYLKKNGK